MNPKFRSLYLIIGAAGLIFLIYTAITTFPLINPINILCITVPDMLFFYLAYKTYPIYEEAKNYGHARRRSA